MSGKNILQQEDFEFLCTHNLYKYYEKYTTPYFFILKLKRNEKNDYKLYDRGLQNKINHPKTLAIYHFTDSVFIPMSDFTEESDKINYEIIADYRQTSYYTRIPDLPVGTWVSTYMHSNLILKSTFDEKYKHDFFTFEGEKVFEITSKYPIEYWSFVIKNTKENENHPDFYTLKFYTEISGKNKTKKKTVCHYNVKTKQFYK
jgi:hypothetical protein